MTRQSWVMFLCLFVLFGGLIVICTRLELDDALTAAICAMRACCLVLATGLCVCLSLRRELNAKPEAERIIVSLNAIEYGSDKPECPCVICLVDFEPAVRVVQLEKCQHVFHLECIAAWVTRKAECPACRAPLTTTRAAPAVLLV